jgi:hypothetical protein
MTAARAATSPDAVAIHIKSVDCCKLAPLVVPLLLRPVHLAETKWGYPIFSTALLRVYFGYSLTLICPSAKKSISANFGFTEF